ncbi:hypothetical protein EMIT0P294_160075 [Pseudomonas sp. IT-P294]
MSGRNPVTDIDHALHDLAAHAERQFGLDAGLNITGECHRGGVIRCFNLLDEDPWALLLNGLFIAARSQQDQKAQANHCFQSGTSHANSFALYGRANGDTTVSLEQGSTGALAIFILPLDRSHALVVTIRDRKLLCSKPSRWPITARSTNW